MPYGKTMEGWDVESAGGKHEAIYSEAEQKLAEANQLIEALNKQLMQINTSLASTTPATTP